MKHPRITAILTAMAIAAAACGSGATGTADADRIAELEAQVEALTAQAEEDDEAIATPTTQSDTKVVVATTAAPEVAEPDVPDETETPVEPEPEDSQADTATEPETAETAAPAEGFAAPNGPAITPTSNAVEMMAILGEVRGPTDDLPATFARVGRFPIVPTMPDTSIVDLSYDVQNEYIFSSEPGGHRSTARVEFTTSAQPQDVVLAYQTDLAAQGYGDISTGEQNQNDITFYTVRLGEYSTGQWEAVAWSREGVTFATLRIVIDRDEPKPEAVDAISGFVTGIPVADGALLDQVSLRAFGTGTIKIEAQHTYPGVEMATIRAGHDDRIDSSDWTFSEMVATSFKLTSANEPGGWTIRYDEFETTSQYAETPIRTLQYTTYDDRP